ncbi:TRAP-type mannitol/chloroaromatic compound transport system, small permease component [Tranquillimonas rosea]|uniref:TRAP transporter small permease protein n=1 Tax=Tranquillimonas rosea TaxID=641238 RepID=A0A1H9WAN3_9RHOB|nr:TRAP transporter small permease [Tranquillimonas rosea]SES31002.1 TRAP-type mannitol/chloroaromatic compound transport system, small permease component [Tranquillimonas rosea]
MTDQNRDTNETDGGEISRPDLGPLSRGFGTTVVGMDILGALVVLGMMIVVNLDVFGRWLFNAPFQGTVELSEMGIVAMVYLQIALTIRKGRLTRADTLLSFLARTGRDRIGFVLRAAFNLSGTAVFAIIAYGQFPRLIASYNGGYFKGNVGVFTAPVWPLDTIILIGSIFASLQFLGLAISNIRNLTPRGRATESS